ncbi:MAG: 50S ribosomal protein L10 [Methanosaeta sp. PtaB.Bin018]|mgnify:CR=1 FL=1|jgi:large subunit ribosomal protein L10|nr:50S ribosomal protein L10 [Methanothrix sp.]OPX77190.1 MAG: 50S ribosomal protein L10 [Methanosaeta sp. PtaB.Bin018]
MAGVVRRTAHLPEWKVKDVQELIEKISKSRVIGVVGLREIPASNLQQMRGDLRGNVEIRMVRNTIARRALEASDPKIRPLADYIEDQTALIFCDENPFRLSSMLEKGKKPMPIKPGAKAPKDIVVEAGETSFSPGPMVGKLQAAGIPAAIKGGKVVINQRITLAKEGDVVSAKTAEILKTMEIFPKLVGLDLRAVYEGGLIFKSKDLCIDVGAQISELSLASAKAFSFAVEIGYATPETVGPMLQKAQSKAIGLVMEAGIPVPSQMELILAKAASNAKAIASLTSGEMAPSAAAGAAAPVEEEEEKKDEGDAAAGLGALFG